MPGPRARGKNFSKRSPDFSVIMRPLFGSRMGLASVWNPYCSLHEQKFPHHLLVVQWRLLFLPNGDIHLCDLTAFSTATCYYRPLLLLLKKVDYSKLQSPPLQNFLLSDCCLQTTKVLKEIASCFLSVQFHFFLSIFLMSSPGK